MSWFHWHLFFFSFEKAYSLKKLMRLSRKSDMNQMISNFETTQKKLGYIWKKVEIWNDSIMLTLLFTSVYCNAYLSLSFFSKKAQEYT